MKALGIPYHHPEGLFAPNTYFFAKGETDKKILTDLYHRQMKALDALGQSGHRIYLIKISMKL